LEEIMSSYWHKSYDRYKDRRYASLFFSAFMTTVGVLPAIGLAAYLCRNLFPQSYEQIYEAAGVAVFPFLFWIVARFCNGIAEARRSAREKANLSELSSDERAKARSKLLKNRNRVTGILEPQKYGRHAS
jgi:hypothetical protein